MATDLMADHGAPDYFLGICNRFDPMEMIENWQIGDLAECIKGGHWLNCIGHEERGPEVGDILTVIALPTCFIRHGLVKFSVCALGFWAFGQNGYDPAHFRKIPADVECEQLLKLIHKPTKEIPDEWR